MTIKDELMTYEQIKNLKVGDKLISTSNDQTTVKSIELSKSGRVIWLELEDGDYFTETDGDESFLRFWKKID